MIEKIFGKFLQKRKRKPFSAWQVELTTRCPLLCKMCIRSESTGWQFQDMPFEDFKKILPYLKDVETVVLEGWGESLLHKNLIECIELVKKEHPRYVLWLCAKYEFRESTFNIIRREGSAVIGWFLDDEFRFDDYSKWWIPYLDCCVTHDIEAVPKYKALGASVIHVPPSFGIRVDRDWSNLKEDYDISFVGRKSNPSREQYINELTREKIPIHLKVTP